jgi:single-strand DNA-binding protein
MEQITGRLVRNAEIKKTKDNREFVTFTVAVNDRYKPKGKEEIKETRYFNCSYWLGTKVKDALKQSTVVSAFGRVNINAYKGTDGEFHANLTFFTNYIEIHGGGKREAGPTSTPTVETPPTGAPETKDDLPF